MNEIKQWALADEDGFVREVIDYDPSDKFHAFMPWHPVQPELVGVIDQFYQWNGEYWDEPELGYTKAKKDKSNVQRRVF